VRRGLLDCWLRHDRPWPMAHDAALTLSRHGRSLTSPGALHRDWGKPGRAAVKDPASEATESRGNNCILPGWKGRRCPRCACVNHTSEYEQENAISSVAPLALGSGAFEPPRGPINRAQQLVRVGLREYAVRCSLARGDSMLTQHARNIV
jgi:hypothetical protein